MVTSRELGQATQAQPLSSLADPSPLPRSSDANTWSSRALPCRNELCPRAWIIDQPLQGELVRVDHYGGPGAAPNRTPRPPLWPDTVLRQTPTWVQPRPAEQHDP